MTDAIGPGDWVECIRDAESFIDNDRPVRGAVELVTSVEEYELGCFDCGATTGTMLSLKGHPTNAGGWCSCNFRPIYRPTHRFTVEEFSADKVFA